MKKTLKDLGYIQKECNIENSKKYHLNEFDSGRCVEETIYIHKNSETVEVSQKDFAFTGGAETVQLDFEQVEAIYNKMKEVQNESL